MTQRVYNERTAAKVYKALLKGTKNNNRECLRAAWIDEKGRFCALDGFRAYRVKTPLAGVPDFDPEEIQPIDLARVYPTRDNSEFVSLELPTLEELRAMQAEDRRDGKKNTTARQTSLYSFGEMEDGSLLPTVRLDFLAEAVELFPQGRAYATRSSVHEHCHVNPIVFEDENGDAILLPVRVSDPEKARKRRMPPAVETQPAKKRPALSLRSFAAMYAPI